MRVTSLFILFSLTAGSAWAQNSPYGEYESFVPDQEFSTMADGKPPPTELVARLFALAYAEPCSWGLSGDPEMLKPETYDLTYRYDFDESDAPDRSLRLYQLFCGAGAYNVQHVFMSWTADDGLRSLSFAQPTFDATFEREDGPVASISLTGQSATSILVNASVDPATGTITAQSCWRGLCDASSVGTWVLDGPQFTLQRFLVDASYDGEVSYISLVDYAEPIPLPVTFVETPDLPLTAEGDFEE